MHGRRGRGLQALSGRFQRLGEAQAPERFGAHTPFIARAARAGYAEKPTERDDRAADGRTRHSVYHGNERHSTQPQVQQVGELPGVYSRHLHHASLRSARQAQSGIDLRAQTVPEAVYRPPPERRMNHTQQLHASLPFNTRSTDTVPPTEPLTRRPVRSVGRLASVIRQPVDDRLQIDREHAHNSRMGTLPVGTYASHPPPPPQLERHERVGSTACSAVAGRGFSRDSLGSGSRHVIGLHEHRDQHADKHNENLSRSAVAFSQAAAQGEHPLRRTAEHAVRNYGQHAVRGRMAQPGLSASRTAGNLGHVAIRRHHPLSRR